MGLGASLPQNVLIVEDDEDTSLYVSELLREQGVAEVQTASSGQTAWRLAEATHFDFILLDWRLPSLSGLALLNRFRGHPHYVRVPLIVVSGFLGEKDFHLIQEFAVTGGLTKPFSADDLFKLMDSLWKEASWYHYQQMELANLFKNQSYDGLYFLDSIRELAKKSPRPLTILLLGLRHLRQQGWDSEAESLAGESIRTYGNLPALLTELGRILIGKNRYKEAMNVLTKANELSPSNLDRYCYLGEASLGELDISLANQYFDQALAIDGDASKAKNGKLLSKNLNIYLQTNGAENLPKNFASMLNAIGVAKVGMGEVAQGIEQYHAALHYVSASFHRSKILYNLGLAHVRLKELAKAAKFFSEALKLDPNAEKAKVWLDKIDHPSSDDALDDKARKEGVIDLDHPLKKKGA